jgi:hypothetical protein
VHVEPVDGGREAALAPLEVRVRRVARRSRRPRQEGAAGEGELGAAGEGGGLGRLVAALLGGALVEVAMTAQPAHGPVAHTLGDLGDIVRGGRHRLLEGYALVRLLERAVSGERVQVRVKVERTTKQLGTGDRARAPAGNAGEPLRQPLDLFREDAVHGAEHRGLARHEKPQLPGQGEYPLPDGYVGQDPIDHLYCLVAHPARAATWTERPVLAGEGAP